MQNDPRDQQRLQVHEAASTSHDDENSIIAERRAKLARLRLNGKPAFPNDFRPAHHAGDLSTHHGFKSREDLEAQKVHASQIEAHIGWVTRGLVRVVDATINLRQSQIDSLNKVADAHHTEVQDLMSA